MNLKDISKFEKMNNFSVDVYGLTDTKKVQILKISNNYKNDKTHIDLLYDSFEENSDYAHIKKNFKINYSIMQSN